MKHVTIGSAVMHVIIDIISDVVAHEFRSRDRIYDAHSFRFIIFIFVVDLIENVAIARANEHLTRRKICCISIENFSTRLVWEAHMQSKRPTWQN